MNNRPDRNKIRHKTNHLFERVRTLEKAYIASFSAFIFYISASLFRGQAFQLPEVILLSAFFLSLACVGYCLLKMLVSIFGGYDSRDLKRLERRIACKRKTVILFTLILSTAAGIMLTNMLLLGYSWDLVTGSILLAVLEGYVYYIPKTARWIDRKLGKGKRDNL